MNIVPSKDRSTIRREKINSDQLGIRTWRYWLFVLILVAGFGIPDHEWRRSLAYADTDYTGSENITADRLAGVNKRSTICKLILAFIGIGCFWRQRRFKLCKQTPLLWLTYAMAAIISGSVLWSINPALSLFKAGSLGCLVVSAMGFATFTTLRQLLEWIALTCAIFILAGLAAEISLGTFNLGSGERFTGTTHPNTEAIFGAILCLCARLFYRSDRRSWFAISLFALGAIIIYLTKSRTTLAAVVASLAVTQLLTIRGTRRWYLMLAVAFVGGVTLFATLLINQQGAGKLSEMAVMGRTENVSSLTGRLPLWEELLTSLAKSPVLGYGYLAFWDADRVEYLSDTFRWEIPHGHNMYLDMALDVGIVGSLLYVCWLLSALVRAANLFAKNGKAEYAIVAGILVFAMINGIAESLFKLPGFPLFILIATTISLLHQEPDTATRTDTSLPLKTISPKRTGVSDRL